jgi:hypothetical protein
MPQIQFNEDGVWHECFHNGKTALKGGPWFPYVVLFEGVRLKSHCMHSP